MIPIPLAIQRIIETLIGAEVKLLNHNVGIRTLQLIGEKTENAIVQKLAGKDLRTKVVSATLLRLEELCKHPFGSKVIEEYLRSDAAVLIARALLTLPEARLTELMNHKIGNYVIQTTFDFAPSTEQYLLAREIQNRASQNQIEHKNVAQRCVLFSIFEGAVGGSLDE